MVWRDWKFFAGPCEVPLLGFDDVIDSKINRPRGKGVQMSYDPRSYKRNFCNCGWKPEIFRTSTGFEPVTSRYRYDALTN